MSNFIFRCAALGLVLSGCSLLDRLDNGNNSPSEYRPISDRPVREGCIGEKMMDGYTYQFSRDICEGQYYMYGERKPRWESDLEDLQRDLYELQRELDSID